MNLGTLSLGVPRAARQVYGRTAMSTTLLSKMTADEASVPFCANARAVETLLRHALRGQMSVFYYEKRAA